MSRPAMPLQFVNIHNQPVTIANSMMAAHDGLSLPKLKRTRDAEKATAHLGFEVVGVLEKRMVKAQEQAQARMEKWRNRGEKSKAKEPPAWDANAWLDKQKVRRAVTQAFTVESAAQVAADMLKGKGGWLRVSVMPILAYVPGDEAKPAKPGKAAAAQMAKVAKIAGNPAAKASRAAKRGGN